MLLERQREPRSDDTSVQRPAEPFHATDLNVGLLTGGQDKSYAIGLAMTLVSKGVTL